MDQDATFRKLARNYTEACVIYSIAGMTYNGSGTKRLSPEGIFSLCVDEMLAANWTWEEFDAEGKRRMELGE